MFVWMDFIMDDWQ
ncbi:hypothetical protein SOVF_085460, partial [Spinacia oleracea]